jgi:WD40 repeat protein
MWDWNNWDTATKWIGHPSSVDSICKLDENAICTGGSDGLLRLISIAPQNFEGILGDHGQDFPIECVKMNHDDKFLGSCGHDLQLRFWNVQFLFDNEDKEEEREENEASHGNSLSLPRRRKLLENEADEPLMKRPKTRGQFFENL